MHDVRSQPYMTRDSRNNPGTSSLVYSILMYFGLYSSREPNRFRLWRNNVYLALTCHVDVVVGWYCQKLGNLQIR